MNRNSPLAYIDFAPFYDPVMGDRSQSAAKVLKLIRDFAPKARNVLELACGTGAILQHLAKSLEVSGLDISPAMLKVAKRRLPDAALHLADIRRFKLNEKFDVIICVFDSINHLLTWRDWLSVFDRVQEHLVPGGLFLFDVHTVRELDRICQRPPWLRKFGKNYAIIEIRKNKADVAAWNIKILQHVKDTKYRLREETIHEASFPIAKVSNALRKVFKRVKCFGTQGQRASEKLDKIYFACRL